MKILLINNYSMETAYALWKKKTSGSHHLWGKVELEKRGKIEMLIFPHIKYKFLNKIGKFIGISHLDQQVRILGNLNKFDILYAPYATANTKLLLLLKWMGIFRKPIVVLIHQSFSGTRSKNKWVRKLSKQLITQYDACIFLSEPLLEDTVKRLELSPQVVEEKFSAAQWGPDVDFYQELNDHQVAFENCSYAISAGHTDRDYETLIEAFREINFPLRIYCTPTSIPKVKKVPDNVQIISQTVPYFDLLNYYNEAIVILVPLKYADDKEGCQGMTSLQDVIALSKPVIMTKNKTLNLDVEKEGFGYWVDMYDVEGWRNAFSKLVEDENKWYMMSRNANKVFSQKSNSRIFADSLERVFLNVYKKTGKEMSNPDIS